MHEYAITFARSARKELEALDARMVNKILSRIEALAQEPRPGGARKLQGQQNLWRVRIGDYRAVYSWTMKRGMSMSLPSVTGGTPIASRLASNLRSGPMTL